ncbi:(S)-ureidoglycine aminohydrolase [Neotamlana laminarinivorans]|uniref:(S)-ureidoglycine aminohydrolase n=1 Tax=Neotamlana laminarinivorans TaxID=2883124 RepID=A0A9X1L119_9FLAO|nr:(S)-ureidoglycine aminohydrolase [Tamlana laminarinivorans]MCB4798195.1 (S)-ureidoglycine aminohydrolase [Tamlana laminarinivorans]
MNKIKLTAISTTVVERDHAVITGDGFVNSAIPGWTNCEVNVVINEAMGAKFCQLLVTLNKATVLKGTTEATQIFFYVIDGSSEVIVDGKTHQLTQGSYVYIPVNKNYEFKNASENTKFLTFHKTYEFLEGYKIPDVIVANQSTVNQNIYCDDPDLLMQNLLPDQDNFSFDMAVNIFTYNPGANLPFVETHIMEHGLIYLQGQGIYRLADKWYPIKKGDSIWMAPYCPQWFGALGKEPAVYIYYKNVNRFPIKP